MEAGVLQPWAVWTGLSHSRVFFSPESWCSHLQCTQFIHHMGRALLPHFPMLCLTPLQLCWFGGTLQPLHSPSVDKGWKVRGDWLQRPFNSFLFLQYGKYLIETPWTAQKLHVFHVSLGICRIGFFLMAMNTQNESKFLYVKMQHSDYFCHWWPFQASFTPNYIYRCITAPMPD